MNSKIKLICFPFAGAGASFFTNWSQLVKPNIEIVPFQLPGRERLILEPPYENVHTAAKDFSKEILDNHDNDSIILFGHCFLGAIIAFEVSKLIESHVNLLHLFVSAAPSPFSKRNYKLSQCTDDNLFLKEIENLTGYSHPAFKVPELRELLLPTLRSDFKMDETYLPSEPFAIKTSITAIYANKDHFVSKHDILLWEKATLGEFKVEEVVGPHMYISNSPQQCLNIIQQILDKNNSTH